MKSLYESILSDAEKNSNDDNINTKTLDTFGYYFKFKQCEDSNNIASLLNLSTLKKLTADNDNKSEIQILVNFLDNVSFEDLCVDTEDMSSTTIRTKAFRKKLGELLEIYCKGCGIFKPNKDIHLYVKTTNLATDNDLIIVIYESKHNSLEIIYEIE
jgi:hypothetical protein